MNKMKVALIGYGYWGKVLEKYLMNSNVFDLICIYTPSAKKDGKFINSLDNIVESKEIQAVFLATPIDTHYALAKFFIQNNIHVFCEKPLTKTSKEAEYLKELAEKKNVKIETNFIYLDSPSIKKIKELLKNVGTIQYVYGNIKQFGKFYKNDDVYNVIGCHLLSAILFLFEQYDYEITCQTKLVDNNGNALCGEVKMMASNFIIDLDFNLKCIEKERKLTIYGEKAILIFNMLVEDTVQLYYIENDNFTKSEKYSFDEKNNISYSLERFNDVIHNKRKSNIDLSIEVSKILERIGN